MRFRELRIEARPQVMVPPGTPFRWTTHHVREIFVALLPKAFVLDGSSVIQITCGPRGRDEQYRQILGSSQYFVEDLDFAAYAASTPALRERMILKTVEDALCDIAGRVGKEDAELRSTAAAVVECHFKHSVEVARLRKILRPSRHSIRVFRCLGSELGETWTYRIAGRDGSVIAEGVVGKTPNYLDRRDCYKTAELTDGFYVVRDNLQKETFRLNVAEFSE